MRAATTLIWPYSAAGKARFTATMLLVSLLLSPFFTIAAVTATRHLIVSNQPAR